MEEVDGEGVFSEPEEVFGGKSVFELGREEDSEADEVHADPSKEPWEILAEATEILTQVIEVCRPARPRHVCLGVGGEPESDEHEYRGDETANPGARVEPVKGGLVVGEVGEEGAEKELHVECYCLMLDCELKMRFEE